MMGFRAAIVAAITGLLLFLSADVAHADPPAPTTSAGSTGSGFNYDERQSGEKTGTT
jgi:hypothetical protein